MDGFALIILLVFANPSIAKSCTFSNGAGATN
jgi:hypothetical protein